MKFYDETEKKRTLEIREKLKEYPDYIKGFIRGIEPKTTTRTRLEYLRDLSYFFNFMKENNAELKNKKICIEDISNLKFTDFEKYMEWLKNPKVRYKDINQNTTIKRRMASLKTFYKYLYTRDIIKENPIDKVLLPKIREKSIIKLTDNEIKEIFNKIEENNNKNPKSKLFQEKTKIKNLTIFSILLGTGIRVSELVGIDTDDIDIKNTSIRIKRKGAKEQVIYFSDEIAKILIKYLEYRNKITAKNNESEKALFLSRNYTRMTTKTVQRIVTRYCKKVCPNKHITPHKLRSTYGTNLYNATNDIYLVASVLGHNDINTTKKFYADMEEQRKYKARNIVKLRRT